MTEHRKVDYPPTSETMRLRVLVRSNGHSANREQAAHDLLRREYELRRSTWKEKRRGGD